MPGKKQPKTIPLLKGHSYGEAYFKHEPDIVRPDDPLSLQHFEIHNRCIWKNTIPAHRLDFYMVFLVVAGEGIQTFGLHDHYIKKNMLGFVGPHVISAWQSQEEEHRGFFCTFSDDFFNAGRENKQFLNELPFFQIDGNAVLHLTDPQMEYYMSLFKLMDTEYKGRSTYSDDVLRGHLHALLSKAYAEHRLDSCHADKPDPSGLRLLKAFKASYLRDFHTLKLGRGLALKKIGDYADELGVSQNHLNDVIKAITGRSAGQLIRNHLIRHATLCLKHSGKTVSEVAYLLGFEDPSYFSRFYKNQTGKSPSEFR